MGIVKKTIKELEEYQTQAGFAKDASEKLAEKIEELGTAFSNAKDEINGVNGELKNISDVMGDSLAESGTEGVNMAISAITSAFISGITSVFLTAIANPDVIKSVAIAMNNLGPIIAGALAALGPLIATTLVAIFTSPWFWIIAAIVGIAAILIFKGDEIAAALINTWQNIQKTISPILETLTGIFSTFATNVSAFFTPVLTNLQTILQGIIDFVQNVFLGNWQAAWEDVVSIFSTIFDGIPDFVKAPLNFIIDQLNSFFSGIGNIEIPDWMPGIGGMSFSIPTIPRLASGGLAFGQTLAIVGDNANALSDPEVISPLSTLQSMISGVIPNTSGGSDSEDYNKMATTIANAVTASLSSANINANIESSDLRIDSNSFGKVVFNLMQREAKVQGYNFFTPRGAQA